MKNLLLLVRGRVFRAMLWSFAFLTLAGILIVVLVDTVQTRRRQSAYERGMTYRRQASDRRFDLDDFYLNSQDVRSGILYPSLQPRRTWSSDERESYLIDPEDARFDDLPESNDALIRRVLSAGDSEKGP